jgi:hypothetical protein
MLTYARIRDCYKIIRSVAAKKRRNRSVCGRDLSGVEAIFAGKRQVIDIQPVVPIITEHQVFSRQPESSGHCGLRRREKLAGSALKPNAFLNVALFYQKYRVGL